MKNLDPAIIQAAAILVAAGKVPVVQGQTYADAVVILAEAIHNRSKM